MACPFFFPTSALRDRQAWAVPPRLPLGEACDGVCHAGAAPSNPEPEALRDFCNRGYGRLGCSRFPPESEADAIRFSLESDRDGALGIICIFERDYGPARHGRIEFHESTGAFTGAFDDPVVLAQARMFIANYLRRRVTV